MQYVTLSALKTDQRKNLRAFVFMDQRKNLRDFHFMHII